MRWFWLGWAFVGWSDPGIMGKCWTSGWTVLPVLNEPAKLDMGRMSHVVSGVHWGTYISVRSLGCQIHQVHLCNCSLHVVQQSSTALQNPLLDVMIVELVLLVALLAAVGLFAWRHSFFSKRLIMCAHVAVLLISDIVYRLWFCIIQIIP